MSMPVVIIILVGIFLAFVILMVMSFKPKSMGKSMGHMMETAIQMQKQILEEHGEDLKELNKKSAEIESDGLEIKARAIKKGLVGDEAKLIFCKHCGKEIDADSTFCRYCGKEQ